MLSMSSSKLGDGVFHFVFCPPLGLLEYFYSILLYLEHSNIPIPYIVLFRCSFFITLRGTAPVNSEAIGTIAVL